MTKLSESPIRSML